MSALSGRLAEALRLMIERAACEVESLHELGRDDDDTAVEALVAQSELEAARDTLAAWEENNPARFATEYRVEWEIDAFSATNPREAAQEAWDAMRRPDSTANVFTVRGRDGSVTEIDLGDAV